MIFIVSAITFLGVSLLFLFHYKGYTQPLPASALKFVSIAGLLNLGGWFFYQQVFHELPDAEVASVVMILCISMPIFTAVGDWIFFDGTFSLNKVLGLAAGIVSIVLLSK